MIFSATQGVTSRPLIRVGIITAKCVCMPNSVGATTELAMIEPAITPEGNPSPLNSWITRGLDPAPPRWTQKELT
jgi:hypothetical protein